MAAACASSTLPPDLLPGSPLALIGVGAIATVFAG